MNRKSPHSGKSKPVDQARRLRGDSTFPERLLWSRLRRGELARLKFRRQHPVGPFIVDFYCHQARLAIELDGASHDGRADEDNNRTAYLNSNGLRVFRVGNDDVLDDVELVLRAILKECGLDPESGAPQE